MSRVAADVLLRLCILWNDFQSSSDRDIKKTPMLKPNIVIQQLIHWTNPTKVINRKENDAAKSSVQIDFLLDLLHVFSQIDKKEIRRMILTNINNFYITSQQPVEKLKEVQILINEFLQNEILDNLCKNALNKFSTTLRTLIEIALSQCNGGEDEGNLGYTDQQLSKVLDESMVIDDRISTDKDADSSTAKDSNGVVPTDISNKGNNSKKRNRNEVKSSNKEPKESLQISTSKSVSFVISISPSVSTETRENSDVEMND